jgi:hypothetical protein
MPSQIVRGHSNKKWASFSKILLKEKVTISISSEVGRVDHLPVSMASL